MKIDITDETHRHKLGHKREDILNSQDVRYVTFLYETCTARYFTLGALFECFDRN